MSLSTRVKERMDTLKLTQESLAKLVGISQTAIFKLTSGKSQRTRYLIPLAKALQCSPEWLESGKGDIHSHAPVNRILNPPSITEIRRHNLQDLIVEKFDARSTKLAQTLGCDLNDISRILSRRAIFEREFARDIEQRLNLTTGWLDQAHFSTRESPTDYAPEGSEVVAWGTWKDLPDPNAYVTVPHHDVRLSAGPGAEPEWVEHADNDQLAFRVRWFRAKGIRPEHCRGLYVHGASMEPALLAGDTVIIDTSQTEIQDDEIYAALYHGELYIKRLFKLPRGGIELRSDNPAYREIQIFDADLERLTVLGRKVWRAG